MAEVRRERDRIRWELQEACRAEQARVDRLVAEATTWDTRERIRNYVRARLEKLKASGVDVSDDSKTARWAVWAMKQADRLDPIVKSTPSILDEKPETFWALVGKGMDWKDFFVTKKMG